MSQMPGVDLAAAGRRIDVHCHAIPAPYRAALDAHGIAEDSGAKIPSWSPQLALTFMRKYGISAQLVSISEPGVSFLAQRQDRVALAQDVNDFMSAELVHATDTSIRGRFGTFALLPLLDLSAADVDAASEEAVRALRTVGCDGIGMFTNYRGVYLGDARLDRLYATLDELDAVVFLHSAQPKAEPASTLPPFLCEFVFDTTRAVASLGRSRVFDRYPRIRWVLAHAGGTLPYLAHRISTMSRYAGGASHVPDSGIRLDRLFYDTALSPAPASVGAVLAVAPLSHLLFGTDWPFSADLFQIPGDPAPQLKESLTPAERVRVDRLNALSLFPRLAERIS